jgi:hypothetical protein
MAPMIGKRAIRRIADSASRTLMCLVVLAFIVRAMVPVGFMPDPSALNAGAIQITFCTADNATSAIFLNLGGHHKTDPGQHGGAMGCPFGLLAAQALGTPSSGAALPLPAIALFRVIPFAASPLVSSVPTQGPPLGSRAPPNQAVAA